MITFYLQKSDARLLKKNIYKKYFLLKVNVKSFYFFHYQNMLFFPFLDLAYYYYTTNLQNVCFWFPGKFENFLKFVYCLYICASGFHR